MFTAVITMEKITSLLPKLSARAATIPHLVHLTFVQGKDFRWNHNNCSITYNPNNNQAVAQLLHEFGHATLGHSQFKQDVELFAMERAAWHQAQNIASELGLVINSDYVEDLLDTYRDWLHARSCCPHCGATGVQFDHNGYQCLACSSKWRVNDARMCQLRRYQI